MQRELKKRRQDKITNSIERKISESKKRILDYYNITADISDVTEDQYEELIKYKVHESYNHEPNEKSSIEQDKLAEGAYTWGKVAFYMFIIGGILLAALTISVSFISAMTLLIVYIIGRIVELLNEINERIRTM